MSPTRLGYRELDFNIFSLEENHSISPKKPPMEEEKRDNGVGYPIKFLLEESLTRHRNDMMDNFTHIL
jgi:hypothetical protein